MAQIQLVSVVQLGLRHAPLEHVIAAGHSLSAVHVPPHDGTGVGVGVIVGVGVGVGVGVAVGQTQVSEVVQLGFRQTPLTQLIPLPQFAVTEQVLPHAGTGVGVGVGDAATVNSSEHETLLCACGCDSGAVGATGVCVAVRLVIMTTPIAPAMTKMTAMAAMISFFLSIFTMLPKVYNCLRYTVDTGRYILLLG